MARTLSVFRGVPPTLRREVERDALLHGRTIDEVWSKLRANNILIPRATLGRHLQMLRRQGHREQLLFADAIADALAPIITAVLKSSNKGGQSR
jgi:hypothetical protein